MGEMMMLVPLTMVLPPVSFASNVAPGQMPTP